MWSHWARWPAQSFHKAQSCVQVTARRHKAALPQCPSRHGAQTTQELTRERQDESGAEAKWEREAEGRRAWGSPAGAEGSTGQGRCGWFPPPRTGTRCQRASHRAPSLSLNQKRTHSLTGKSQPGEPCHWFGTGQARPPTSTPSARFQSASSRDQGSLPHHPRPPVAATGQVRPRGQRVGLPRTHLSQFPAGGCPESSHPRGESAESQPGGREGKEATC